MSKGLTPGKKIHDFVLPDENGDMHRLSDLQGDDALVLMLGRGEHCPRERQHQREMVKFQEWCPVAFTQMVTVLPNELHDVYKMKIATGAWWTYLADIDLEVQKHFDIREYTDPHHDAGGGGGVGGEPARGCQLEPPSRAAPGPAAPARGPFASPARREPFGG